MERDAVNRPRATSRTSAGCLTLLLIIAVMLLLHWPIDALLDTLFNPWAHSWQGEPRLVGIWVGTLTSPSGQHLALLLDLRRSGTAAVTILPVSAARASTALPGCALSAGDRKSVPSFDRRRPTADGSSGRRSVVGSQSGSLLR
jgi:hypothetical protein